MKDYLFAVEIIRGNKDVARLLREFPMRMESALTQISYAVASTILDELSKNSPDLQGFKDYKRSFELRQIQGELATFGVVSVAEAMADLRPEEVSNTLIRFEALTESPSYVTQFLVKEGPWPADMVPMRPPRHEVRIHPYRMPSHVVEDRRNQFRMEWDEFVRRARDMGVQLPDTLQNYSGEDVDRSLALQVLAAEYGIGVPMKPHWRPAIARVKREFPQIVKSIERTLSDPRYNGWREKLSAQPLKDAEGSIIEDFQKKITGE